MVLPPIPEQIAKSAKAGGEPSAGGDNLPSEQLFFDGNVAGFLDAYTRRYNQSHENGEQYQVFQDEDSSKHRNTRAKRVIDVILRLEIPNWYGKKTYSQCANLDIRCMRNVLRKISEDPSMSVFAQGQNYWMIRHLVSQKMYSKQKSLRRKSRKAILTKPGRDSSVNGAGESSDVDNVSSEPLSKNMSISNDKNRKKDEASQDSSSSSGIGLMFPNEDTDRTDRPAFAESSSSRKKTIIFENEEESNSSNDRNAHDVINGEAVPSEEHQRKTSKETADEIQRLLSEANRLKRSLRSSSPLIKIQRNPTTARRVDRISKKCDGSRRDGATRSRPPSKIVKKKHSKSNRN